jgi:DNA replication protein DnaC
VLEPAPNPTCPMCNANGFVLSPRGEFSFAKRCTCVPLCSLCNGKGTRTVAYDGGMRTGRCRCQKLPDRIQLFNNTCLPAAQGYCSFESFKHINKGATLAAKSCTTWLQKFITEPEKKGLILSGQVGRGKTHLLISILRALIFERGEKVRFIEFSRLLSILRDGFSKGESNQKLMSEICNIPILAIDELGKGRLTGWERTVIDDIVSGRYNSNGTIIATTNYKWGPPQNKGADLTNLAENFDIQTLGDRVGERVFSRLQEMCYFTPIQGDDFRAKRVQRLL